MASGGAARFVAIGLAGGARLGAAGLTQATPTGATAVVQMGMMLEEGDESEVSGGRESEGFVDGGVLRVWVDGRGGGLRSGAACATVAAMGGLASWDNAGAGNASPSTMLHSSPRSRGTSACGGVEVGVVWTTCVFAGASCVSVVECVVVVVVWLLWASVGWGAVS